MHEIAFLPFKTKPFPHQSEALDRFCKKPFFGLFWEMGTGKSKTAIDIAAYKYLNEQIDRVIVVAPNAVHQQWIDEQFPAHCCVPWKGFVYRTMHTKKYTKAMESFFETIAASDRDAFLPVLSVHIEAFQYEYVEPFIERFCKGARILWIVDEATRIKNPKALCTKRITRLRNTGSAQACVLTGTSLAKGPLGVWSIMEFLDRGIMGCTYTAFERKHSVLKKMSIDVKTRGGVTSFQKDVLINEAFFRRVKSALNRKRNEKGKELDGSDYQFIAMSFDLSMEDTLFIDKSSVFTRFKNIEPLKRQLSSVVAFLRKEECLQLPEKVYKEIVLPLGAEQKRILKELQRYAVATYGDEVLTVQHKVVLQTRGLQVCGGFFPQEQKDGGTLCVPIHEKNAKLEYIKELIDELGEQQFIVWAVFVPEIKMLAENLKDLVSLGTLYGETEQKEREQTITAFKEGRIQCLVANPKVGGFGLNFQNAGAQIWYSRSYSTETRLQAEDRSHRINVTQSPVYIDLVYDVQFEKDVLRVTKEGRDMNAYFNSKTVKNLLEV